ncbi:MAG: hypothetical protein LEGION0403_FIIPPAGN_00847 [Legionella sp.]
MACLYLDKHFNVRISLWADEPKTPRKDRGLCGAKTRMGTPCKAPPVWDIVVRLLMGVVSYMVENLQGHGQKQDVKLYEIVTEEEKPN